MGLDKQYGDGHHGHNVNYLSTSYSFEGRYDDAVEAAKELLGLCGESRPKGTGGSDDERVCAGLVLHASGPTAV